MPHPIDPIWIDAARRLGIQVARGGEAYVHFDGATLHVAGDEHLDADDTVGQLVFHELCHALVQGPSERHVPDWGLDNTSQRHDRNERACIRLQAHLAGAWGLRGLLFPTTGVRRFFEALPADALGAPVELDEDRPGGAGDSTALAREAALRAARGPFGPVLRRALEETARVGAGERRHQRTGLPMSETTAGERCGGCAFRGPGGLCRKAASSTSPDQPARRVFVPVDAAACARWEGPLDCSRCAACCRSAYDTVLVGPREAVVRRQPALLRRDGDTLHLRRRGDRCAALEGPAGGPWRCTIYDDRPRTCRDFEAGGRHCLEARRRVGLSL